MLSGVQTGNGTPHDKYNICGIAHAQTNRKDDIFMQRRLVQNFTFISEWGLGTCLLTKHTLHIPGIFPLHAAYSALRHFFANLLILIELTDSTIKYSDIPKTTKHRAIRL